MLRKLVEIARNEILSFVPKFPTLTYLTQKLGQIVEYLYIFNGQSTNFKDTFICHSYKYIHSYHLERYLGFSDARYDNLFEKVRIYSFQNAKYRLSNKTIYTDQKYVYKHFFSSTRKDTKCYDLL